MDDLGSALVENPGHDHDGGRQSGPPAGHGGGVPAAARPRSCRIRNNGTGCSASTSRRRATSSSGKAWRTCWRRVRLDAERRQHRHLQRQPVGVFHAVQHVRRRHARRQPPHHPPAADARNTWATPTAGCPSCFSARPGRKSSCWMAGCSSTGSTFHAWSWTSSAAALCVSRPTNPTGNVLTDDEIAHLDRTGPRA